MHSVRRQNYPANTIFSRSAFYNTIAQSDIAISTGRALSADVIDA